MNQHSVHTMWCDDIRQELGNKPSFMGVYTGGIVLAALPAVLPRLGLWTTVTATPDEPIQQLSARVVRDDGTILLEMRDCAAPEAGEQRSTGNATRHALMFGAIMAPVEVPLGCRHFQVVVSADGKELPGPKLWVEVDPGLLEQMMMQGAA